MSINGQDPRSNVYLLDGTLQNDFTNGPAGSAAGTALGLDTIREFRVESNAYSAEFGRNSGGQINVLTKSGTNRLSAAAPSSSTATTRSTRRTTSTPLGKPDFHRNQFGGTVGGPIQTDRAFFFFGYEALIERLGRTISTVVPDDNARLGILPSGDGRRSIRRSRRTSTSSRVANGPSLGQGLAESTPSRSTSSSTSISCRGASTTTPTRRGSSSPATPSTMRPSSCRPTTRSSRATFFSRNQFFTGEYRQVFSTRTLNTARLGFSRTRIGQNVESNTIAAAAAVRPRPRV